MSNVFDIWHCKLVTKRFPKHDRPTDSFPRFSLINACSDEYGGENIITCFSGWGGSLTKSELECCSMSLISSRAHEIANALDSLTGYARLDYIQKHLKGE